MQRIRFAQFLLMFVSAVAFAGEESRLTLADAERLWQSHSRELKIARTDVAGAESDVLSAEAAPNPQLSVSTLSISPWEGVGGGGLREKRMDSVFRIDQLIERGGKRELRTRAAESRLEAARRTAVDIERQQRIAFRQAYFDLLLAQERLRIADDMAALQARGLDAGKIRLKAGDIAPADVSRLSVERQRADNEARQAKADLEKTRMALAYLIGREREAQQLVAEDEWPVLSEGALSRDPDFERRPDVLAAKARLDAAEHARDLARAQRTRDVTVGVQYEHNLQNRPTNSYGVGVSMPLFVRNTYDGEIGRAEAELDAAREMHERTIALARSEVAQARSDLLASSDRRQRFERVLLADARRVVDAAEFAYRKGAAGLMDLLDARRTWRQVQLEAAQARADHARALAAWQLTSIQDQP